MKGNIAICPKCQSSHFYEVTKDSLSIYAICANCRAFVKITSFGTQLLEEDAALKKPEILEWWFEAQERSKERIDGDKSLRPNSLKFNPSER